MYILLNTLLNFLINILSNIPAVKYCLLYVAIASQPQPVTTPTSAPLFAAGNVSTPSEEVKVEEKKEKKKKKKVCVYLLL